MWDTYIIVMTFLLVQMERLRLWALTYTHFFRIIQLISSPYNCNDWRTKNYNKKKGNVYLPKSKMVLHQIQRFRLLHNIFLNVVFEQDKLQISQLVNILHEGELWKRRKVSLLWNWSVNFTYISNLVPIDTT